MEEKGYFQNLLPYVLPTYHFRGGLDLKQDGKAVIMADAWQP